MAAHDASMGEGNGPRHYLVVWSKELSGRGGETALCAWVFCRADDEGFVTAAGFSSVELTACHKSRKWNRAIVT